MATRYFFGRPGQRAWPLAAILVAGALLATPARAQLAPYGLQNLNLSGAAADDLRSVGGAMWPAPIVEPAPTAYYVTIQGGCNLPNPTLSSSSPGCAGDTLRLSASGVSTIVTYAWTGPNGFTSNAPSPTIPNVTTAATGIYILTVTDGPCSASDSLAVVVNPAASAAFAYPAGTFCLNAPTAPTITGTAGGTFRVVPATGLSINPQTGALALSTATAGTYTVIYTVAGPCGAADSATLTLTAPSTAGFSYPGLTNGAVCRDTAAGHTLTALLATGATSGTFSSPNPSLVIDAQTGEVNVTGSAEGTYTIYNDVPGGNGCPAVRDSATVRIENRLNYQVETNYSTAFCVGGLAVLRVEEATGMINDDGHPGRALGPASVAGAAFQWFDGNGAIAGATSDTLVVSTTGLYSVTVTTLAGCVTGSDSLSITVGLPDTAAISYGPNSTFCRSSPYPLVPTITGTPGGSFFGAPRGVWVDQVTGEVYAGSSAPGTYVITYVTNGPCPDTASTTITLVEPLSGSFHYPGAPNGTVCPQGAPPTLTVQLEPGAVAGTFSADSPGLVLDPATGTIDVAASTYGTYVVHNFPPATASCSVGIVRLEITLLAPQRFHITTPDTTTFCVGDSARLTVRNLTGMRGGPPPPPLPTTTYQWLLNGIPIANAVDSTYAATQAGRYSVLVTLAVGCGFTSDTTTITVHPRQSAAFIYAAGTFCRSDADPVPVVTGTSGGTFTASGNLPIDSLTGTINLRAAVSGSYQVRYQSPGPCIVSTTATVAITDSLIGTFTYPTIPMVCAGGPRTVLPAFAAGASAGLFSATPAGLALNPVTGAVTAAISAAGTYVIVNTLAASGTCAADSTAVTFVMQAPPVAHITTNGAANLCIGESLTMTASGGVSYLWSTGDTTASITVSTPGDYSMIATSAGGCTSLSDTIIVRQTLPPVATFAYDSTSGCAGTAGGLWPVAAPGATLGTFSSIPATGLHMIYGWINLQLSLPGTYRVVNTALGFSGCTGLVARDTVTITVLPSPAVAIVGLDSIYCTSSAPVVLAGTVNGVPAAGAFLINGTLTTRLNPAALGVGMHAVTFTSTTGGPCESSTVRLFEVRATPAVPVITRVTQPSGVVVLMSSATSGNQWYRNGVAIAGATGPRYTVGAAAGNGLYTVVRTVAGCPSLPSAPQIVTVTGTSADLAAALGVNLYPVPTLDGEVTLELPATLQPTPVSVFDLAGRCVWRRTLPAAASASGTVRHALDLRALPVGVYVLRVATPQGTATRRVVRE